MPGYSLGGCNGNCTAWRALGATLYGGGAISCGQIYLHARRKFYAGCADCLHSRRGCNIHANADDWSRPKCNIYAIAINPNAGTITVHYAITYIDSNGNTATDTYADTYSATNAGGDSNPGGGRYDVLHRP